MATSGAALPLDMWILKEIFHYALEHYGNEDSEYIEVNFQQKADLTAAIIRICLETNATDFIRYEDVDNIPITSPIHREIRIGRNEPCPCSSGKNSNDAADVN